MSWKSIVTTGLLCLIAAPAWAAPALRVRDGGLVASGTHRVFNVFVAPDPAFTPAPPTAMGVELGFSIVGTGSIVSATTTSAWQDDLVAPIGNPGRNPFAGGAQAEGIVVDPGGSWVFASLGSSADASGLISGETLVLTIEVDQRIARLDLAGVYNADGTVGGTMALINQQSASGDTHGIAGGRNSGASLALNSRFGIIGDFDLDGDVDGGDLGVFAGQFNSAPGVAAVSVANFDGDMDVDGGDLGTFSARFGLNEISNPGGGGIVPEPASWTIFLLGALALGLRRNRSSSAS